MSLSQFKNQGKNIGVLGGGSWATAIVKMLCNNQERVTWWMRNEEAVDHLARYHHNPHYLQAVQFEPSRLHVTTNMQEAVDECDYLIIAIPSAYLFSEFDRCKPTGL